MEDSLLVREAFDLPANYEALPLRLVALFVFDPWVFKERIETLDSLDALDPVDQLDQFGCGVCRVCRVCVTCRSVSLDP